MNKRLVVGVALFAGVALGIGCTVLWRSMSRKYIAKWDIPAGGTASKPATSGQGNVCIVQHAHGASEPLACANVQFFPGVYNAIGVDESRIVKWQNDNGFDSGGVDRTGALLAPGYPIFSRLAWTQIDPVYLQGNDLSMLLEESKRISESSANPAVKASLEELLTLATKAQEESKVLRFFG
jgi:hypothetical protein